MRSLDDPPQSAADLHRLRQVSALFDYAELISQFPAGAEREKLVRRLIHEGAHLSAVNMISRMERNRIQEILSDMMPGGTPVQ